MEFLGLALVLLIPLIYLMVFASQVQAAAFAAVAAADQAAKVVVGGTDGSAGAQAHNTVRLTLEDYGITADRYEVSLVCSAQDCTQMQPGEVVEARVDVRVPLPLTPHAWADSAPVTVGSEARARVPRF
ncbi:hypothetical protein [Micrococcus sp.]|uniref:hypothetical protein n=1 Tax=Micrococcus sp. TaxID=1271 RepID=UPI002A91D059|nr:hypothetical protein [Micrococcus sp.]MDY6055084.1 hypothetical protein [Micrococcus sp.]